MRLPHVAAWGGGSSRLLLSLQSSWGGRPCLVLNRHKLLGSFRDSERSERWSGGVTEPRAMLGGDAPRTRSCLARWSLMTRLLQPWAPSSAPPLMLLTRAGSCPQAAGASSEREPGTCGCSGAGHVSRPAEGTQGEAW